ncbi:hypothetical protein ENSA5_68300 [Enhygromyxa salina]|uniref:Uncharacterized protein n=1 Tax=Enhygromyxa salina TaxID=215803 RepID=A0A2S9XB31_9BACT|nr:hypothetical protein ENSA5_68300 [Enhygromyxa salina]
MIDARGRLAQRDRAQRPRASHGVVELRAREHPQLPARGVVTPDQAR